MPNKKAEFVSHWYFGGRGISPKDLKGKLGRIYLSLKQEHFKASFDYIRTEIYPALHAKGFFQYKIANPEHPEYQGRSDAGLLYFDSPCEAEMHQAIIAMSKKHPEFFTETRPAFTTPVMDQSGNPLTGISFGQDPGEGESFGQLRSRAIQSSVRIIRILQNRGEKVSPEETDQIIAYWLEEYTVDSNNPGFHRGGQSYFPSFATTPSSD